MLFRLPVIRNPHRQNSSGISGLFCQIPTKPGRIVFLPDLLYCFFRRMIYLSYCTPETYSVRNRFCNRKESRISADSSPPASIVVGSRQTVKRACYHIRIRNFILHSSAPRPSEFSGSCAAARVPQTGTPPFPSGTSSDKCPVRCRG